MKNLNPIPSFQLFPNFARQYDKRYDTIEETQINFPQTSTNFPYNSAFLNSNLYFTWSILTKTTHCTPQFTYLCTPKQENIHYHESELQQHTWEQHSRQPKQAKAVNSWVITIKHLSFTLEQHWIRHLQQQQSATLPQQPAAFVNITSRASGGLSSPKLIGVLSRVAVKLPNPMARPWIRIGDLSSGPVSLSNPCFLAYSKVSNNY